MVNYFMKLSKHKNSKITKEMGEFILDNYHKLSNRKIAKKLKITKSTVHNFIIFNIGKIGRKIKWDNNSLKQIALKYKSKKDFYKGNSGAYAKAWKLNILDKICNHMNISGDIYNRFVYIYQFSDNSIYVGITYNKKQRHLQHLTKGIAKNKTIITYKVSKLLSAQDALALEQKMVDLFRGNGFNVLNKNKCYSLGYVKQIWTKDKIIAAAKSCKTRTEFNRKYRAAYKLTIKSEYYDEVFKHLPPKYFGNFKKVLNLSTKEIFNSCSIASLKYNVSCSAITTAIRNKTKCCGYYWEYVK